MISRRTLLIAASLAAAPNPAYARGLSRGAFTHGVASGDPLPNGVILWTRFVPAGDGRIGWEIAEDEAFTQLAARGEAQARAATDYCVKVDVRTLAPGRRYFYRFLSAAGPSPTGRTLTAPVRGGAPLSIALFSCANYAFGYFHAYADAAAREDIDLALHVGDYIYEYGAGLYPSSTDALRTVEPPHECVTYADYSARYALYHTDPDLLELRRLKPLSAVWDDHEIADNAWREGAANHQGDEGAYASRISAAARAYLNWLPIRPPDRSAPRFYRALDWGDLARIVLLDARYIGRDQQISFGGLTPAQRADASLTQTRRLRAALDNPQRSLLGAAQEAWLARQLSESKQRGQTWQIVAQQVPVAEQIAPSVLASALRGGAPSEDPFPSNLDAWAGYPAARARMLDVCANNTANAVILGGDSHNCWLSTLHHNNRIAALEFGVGSVTSPGLERIAAAAGLREQAAHARRPDLAFCDITNRGYGVLRFSHVRCDAEWVAVGDVSSARRAPAMSTRISAEAGAGGPQSWAVA